MQKLNKGTGCESRTVTAAVSAEAVSVGESQSLGKPEKAGYGRRRILHKRKSEDLQREDLLSVWAADESCYAEKTAAATI